MTKLLATENIESFKYNKEPVKFCLGTLIVIVFCICLIIIATFTQISIKDIFSYTAGPTTGLLLTDFLNNCSVYNYIPQLPAIFFTIGLLDRRFGMSAIILYILIGLIGLPIFAMGGGFHYIYELGFGFILAYIPAAFLTATIIKNDHRILNILKAVVAGVLAIHLIGILYMLFVSTLFNTPGDMISGWIKAQSGPTKIVYDIFFSSIVIYVANLFKRLIWLIMC